jgi:hypothetical protein
MDDVNDAGGEYRGAYKGTIDLVCGAVDRYAKSQGWSQEQADIVLFELARAIQLKPNGRATKFLDHFLFGNGEPIEFDCLTLIMEDRGVRQRVKEEITRRLQQRPDLRTRRTSGGDFLIPIRQKDYQVSDWLNALGSYAIEWEAVDESIGTSASGPVCSSAIGQDWIDFGTLSRTRMMSPASRSPFEPCGGLQTPGRARIYGANEYKWHPASPRVTQCLHQAGDRLTTSNIKSMYFWMIARPCVIDLATGFPTGS